MLVFLGRFWNSEDKTKNFILAFHSPKFLFKVEVFPIRKFSVKRKLCGKGQRFGFWVDLFFVYMNTKPHLKNILVDLSGLEEDCGMCDSIIDGVWEILTRNRKSTISRVNFASFAFDGIVFSCRV